MYMYCPYIRAYILVYVHKELYTFAYVVPETVVFYTTSTVTLFNSLYTLKANLYFARARRPRPHIVDYGKFQIKLILILPAKPSVRVHY